MILGFAFLYVLHSFFGFNPQSAPLTYCFKNSSDIGPGYSNITIGHFEWKILHLRYCGSDYCEKLVRVCSMDEEPMSYFFNVMSYMIVLFLLNCFAIVCLHIFISKEANAKRKPD
jgi:hypothetical protein